MNKKLTMLCGFALVFGCSAAFAAEGAKPAKAENKGQEQKKEAKPAVKAKASKAVLRKLAKDEIGKEAVCPVSGEKFKVTEETISASYKDKVYYFCCPGCDKRFIANPGKYLKKKKAEQAKVYVCPMGDYQGDKPGKCPKCGMNLEEKK